MIRLRQAIRNQHFPVSLGLLPLRLPITLLCVTLTLLIMPSFIFSNDLVMSESILFGSSGEYVDDNDSLLLNDVFESHLDDFFPTDPYLLDYYPLSYPFRANIRTGVTWMDHSIGYEALPSGFKFDAQRAMTTDVAFSTLDSWGGLAFMFSSTRSELDYDLVDHASVLDNGLVYPYGETKIDDFRIGYLWEPKQHMPHWRILYESGFVLNRSKLHYYNVRLHDISHLGISQTILDELDGVVESRDSLGAYFSIRGTYMLKQPNIMLLGRLNLGASRDYKSETRIMDQSYRVSPLEYSFQHHEPVSDERNRLFAEMEFGMEMAPFVDIPNFRFLLGCRTNAWTQTDGKRSTIAGTAFFGGTLSL